MKLNPHDLPPYIKRLNPHLFNLGAVENTKRQQDKRSGSQNKSMEGSAASVVYRVTIISLRKRLVDAHDNLRTGAKPLVDCIAAFLGVDDGDQARITWEYGMSETKGNEGTIVKIETKQTV